MRSDRGQTSAEYLGVLLVVAAIVASLVHVGVAHALASGMAREVCRIGGGDCAAPPGAPTLPGAPDSGPAFGSIPYLRPGIGWDGSVEATVKGGPTFKAGPFKAGAYAKVTVTRERTACRLDENGRAMVKLGIMGSLQAGTTAGASQGNVGLSEDGYVGSSIGWQVSTDEATAGRITGGGALPTPVDPTSIPAGTAITLNEDYFAGLADHANYSLLKADYDTRSGERFSSSVLRLDASHVRITVGDADLVEASTFAGLGNSDFGIGLAGSSSDAYGKARQLDLDISTPAGRAAYRSFVASGRLPGGPAVSNRHDSEVYAGAGKDGLKVQLGPLSLSGNTDDWSVKSVSTLRPDGRKDVMTYDQDDDVSLVGTTIQNRDGSFAPSQYTLRLQNLPGDYVGLIQRDAGLTPDQSHSRDVTLGFTDAGLMRLHDLALAQVVADAHRNGVDLTPAQAQRYLRDGPVAGSDTAQGLARQTTPADVMNYLFQHVADGNAARFADSLLRFAADSPGDPDVFPVTPRFAGPQC